MSKKLTPWVTDIAKTPTLTVPVSKQVSSWSTNISKTPTSYTSVIKNKDSWGHVSASQTYFFDDRFTYDDPLTTFDGLLNTNTANQLGQTAWSNL